MLSPTGSAIPSSIGLRLGFTMPLPNSMLLTPTSKSRTCSRSSTATGCAERSIWLR
jgi:hypothetical protein